MSYTNQVFFFFLAVFLVFLLLGSCGCKCSAAGISWGVFSADMLCN